MVADEHIADGGLIGPHQIPNALSILRIFAVGPIIWYIHQEAYLTALVIAFVASATDGVDGFLARRFDWRSRIGGLLDPLADKLLQISSYVMLTWQGFLPWWLLALVIGRDVVIVAGALAYQLLVDGVSGEPTVVSKLNTILQLGLILWVLVDLSLVPLPDAGFAILMAAVALTTVISGIQYVGIWGRRALASREEGRET